jgi:hypothetical protein
LVFVIQEFRYFCCKILYSCRNSQFFFFVFFAVQAVFSCKSDFKCCCIMWLGVVFNSELNMCSRTPGPSACSDAILHCMTNESEGVFKHVLSSLDQYCFFLCLYLVHNTYCWVG